MFGYAWYNYCSLCEFYCYVMCNRDINNTHKKAKGLWMNADSFMRRKHRPRLGIPSCSEPKWLLVQRPLQGTEVKIRTKEAIRCHSSASKSLEQVFSVDGAPMNSRELKNRHQHNMQLCMLCQTTSTRHLYLFKHYEAIYYWMWNLLDFSYALHIWDRKWKWSCWNFYIQFDLPDY
jgi:hypothetical protein